MKKSEAHWGSVGAERINSSSAEEIPTAARMIAQFREVNQNLRLALEKDDLDLIKEYGDQADAQIEKMINARLESRTDQKALLVFLVEQFVLEGRPESGLKKLICDRLLSEI